MLRIIAILVAPVLLALFFVATTRLDAQQIEPLFLWGGYYLIAHIFFWPPYVVTNYVARRVPLKSPAEVATVMAVCSIVMPVATMILLRTFSNETYTWRDWLRDTITPALVSVGSLWLYASIRGLQRRTSFNTPTANS